MADYINWDFVDRNSPRVEIDDGMVTIEFCGLPDSAFYGERPEYDSMDSYKDENDFFSIFDCGYYEGNFNYEHLEDAIMDGEYGDDSGGNIDYDAIGFGE